VLNFFHRIQILHNFYINPMNQRSSKLLSFNLNTYYGLDVVNYTKDYSPASPYSNHMLQICQQVSKWYMPSLCGSELRHRHIPFSPMRIGTWYLHKRTRWWLAVGPDLGCLWYQPDLNKWNGWELLHIPLPKRNDISVCLSLWYSMDCSTFANEISGTTFIWHLLP
jgi:hypothetical protein